MADIGAAVGVSGPALYWHFKSKQEILGYIFLDRVNRVIAATERALANGGDPLSKLRLFVSAHVLWLLGGIDPAPASYRLPGMYLLRHALEDTFVEQLVAIERPHVRRLREILSEGASTGLFSIPDVNVTAFGLFALMDHVSGWYRGTGHLRPADVADVVSCLAIQMVQGVERPDRRSAESRAGWSRPALTGSQPRTEKHRRAASS